MSTENVTAGGTHRTRHLAALALGWAWVAAAVSLFVVALFCSSSRLPIARPPLAATSGRSEVRARVKPFLDFAAAAPGDGTPRVGLAHAYTAEGLRRLADALGALNKNWGGNAADVVRNAADRVTADRHSLQHADAVHAAFAAAAAELGAIVPQQAVRLDQRAHALDSSRPLLRQERQVRAFFAEAGRAVDDAANARS